MIMITIKTKSSTIVNFVIFPVAKLLKQVNFNLEYYFVNFLNTFIYKAITILISVILGHITVFMGFAKITIIIIE